MRTPEEVSRTWPYKWFGFWAENESDAEEFEFSQEKIPLRDEVFDPKWAEPDIAQIAAYLHQAPVIVSTASPHVKCPYCEAEIGDPGAYHSDGNWLWPEGTHHFVQNHNLRVPEKAIEHFRSSQFQPPQEISGSLAHLWPNF